MKKLLKIFGIALLIIMIVIVIIISVLFIKGKMDEGKAYLTDEYYKDFKARPFGNHYFICDFSKQ